MRPIIYLAGILLLLFLAISLLKSPASSVQSPQIKEAQISEEKERTLLFWKHYRNATDNRLAGSLDSAEVNYRRAIQLNERHEDALYYLGNILLIQGKYAEAEAAWLKLSQINTSSARSFSQLGALYLCIDDSTYFNPPAARQAFQRALSINKEETGPLLRLGQIALLQKDDSTATYFFDAVRGSNHNSEEAFFYAGYLSWKRGDLNTAAKLFRKAVAISKPLQPGDGIIGEGDTRSGVSMVSQNASCPLFHNQIADLNTYSETVDPASIGRRYSRFDRFLSSF